jgi:hypothetical protein
MASQKMIPPKRAGELNESSSNLLVFDFFGFFLRLEKIPQPGEFNNTFRRQNRANQIRLRSSVDLIQMMLRCGLSRHFKPPIGLRFPACSGRRQNHPCRRHHECKLGDQTKDDADEEPREERSCGRSQTSLYTAARTHLSVNKDAPSPRTVHAVGRILPKPFLGGLHHLYVRV